jgi:hypothetical protein
MPNRLRRGAVRRPARVVAATRVKGLSGIFMERAPGPLPIMRSSVKSSSAG